MEKLLSLSCKTTWGKNRGDALYIEKDLAAQSDLIFRPQIAEGSGCVILDEEGIRKLYIFLAEHLGESTAPQTPEPFAITERSEGFSVSRYQLQPSETFAWFERKEDAHAFIDKVLKPQSEQETG